MKKILLSITLALVIGVFMATNASADAYCVQDQYGNEYNFVTIDEINYAYGTVTMAETTIQHCDAPTFHLTGSWVWKNRAKFELTAANPLGDADTGCITTYKLKGNWPSGDWYYIDGPSAEPQPFTFVDCSVPTDTINSFGNLGGGGGASK